jgi:transaldolase
VKDPALPDTLYVTELVVSETVNTMPEATIKATADHGELRGDTVHGTYDASRLQGMCSLPWASFCLG